MSDDDLKFRFLHPFDGPAVTWHELLQREGFTLPAPNRLEPTQVRGSLWQVLYTLGAFRVYFYSTDHLSDDELYGWLYQDWLCAATPDLPLEAASDRRVDLLGSGSE